MNFKVESYIKSHAMLCAKINIPMFEEGINLIAQKFENGKKIITCGNGGSASTASHYVTDWNKMISLATGKKFRGISLCDKI